SQAGTDPAIPTSGYNTVVIILLYSVSPPGALYPDGTSDRLKQDDSVGPGASYTYRWEVRPEFSPTEGDAACLTWVYHSHVEAPRDITAGLIGALLTCKKGILTEEGRVDVDRDVVLMFNVVDESMSWYQEHNIQTFCSDPASVDPDDPDFQESNMMHAINGYMYGNLLDMKLCQGRPVAWHLFGMGNEVDIHSAYFQGNTLLDRGHRADTLSLFPATFVTAAMVPLATGKWLLSCQVNDHLQAQLVERGAYNTRVVGPVLRAEVGDILQVVFLNKADRSYSIQPHGLHFDKQYQGTSYQDGVEKPGSAVSPGSRFTYTWQVLDGPSLSDPPCLSYLYYSGSSPVEDTNAGLTGPLLVCRPGALGDHGKQTKVDRELFLLFSVMDENLSWYLQRNIETYGSEQSDPDNEDFQESNKMHAVNGFMYGNLPGLDMCSGDRVFWYTFGLGTEVDIHGVYWEGNTFQRHGTTRDTLSLFPHTTATVRMLPHTPVCDSFIHNVVCVCVCVCPSPGSIFVGRGENRIGPRYKKAVYRQYTDDTFRTQTELQPEQLHLGILGPIIRVEVGEEVLITFKNRASRPYSIHAHGVVTTDTHTPVQPEFRWEVPESSGPGVSDPNCISYAYYSTVDFVKDVFSGLLGPLVVCRQGVLQRGAEGGTRKRRDVEREFALLFMVFDENESWYLEDNIRTYLHTDPSNFTMDDNFIESNKMHGINGKLYGNLHGLTMSNGQTVDWYLLGMGNEVDIHTVHFHAETFTYKMDSAHRADVFDLFPGTFQTVEMTAGNPGTWLLHCHVADHIHAGMETTFTITGDHGDHLQHHRTQTQT
uniref:ferroxidase n=1 Tax=Hucho hucho TaxID=62062 RepID=A0A4W5JKS9_9TELE